MLAFLAVILFLLCGAILFQFRRRGFFYIAIVYFAQLWAIVSCAYIESGIYITEQQRYSFATGATLSLVFYNMVFFGVYAIGLSKLIPDSVSQQTIRISNWIEHAFLAGISVCVGLLFVNIIISGIPVFSGGTVVKFNFWTEHAAFPDFQRFLAYSPYFGLILGFLFCTVSSNSTRQISLGIFSALLLYQTLEGHKFAMQYGTIVSFLIPFIATRTRVTRWWPLLTIGYLCFVYGLAKFHASVNPYDANYEVLYRIFGLQGHVWWGTDLHWQMGTDGGYRNFVAEMDQLAHPVKNPLETGLYYLTILLGGDLGYDFVVNYNGAYSMGYPAILLHIFGPVGTFLGQVIMGIIVAVLAAFVHSSLKTGYLLSAVLSYRLLWSAYNVTTMGNFGELFNWKNLILLIAIIGSSMFPTAGINRNREWRNRFLR